MHRIHTPCAHLGKNLGREVGVLQIINQRAFHENRMGQKGRWLNAQSGTLAPRKRHWHSNTKLF
jgi:hypothetical protein